MANDNFKGVLFNDGEGLTHTDFNNVQRYSLAQLYEQILERQIGGLALTAKDAEFNGINGANAPTHLAYCINGGSAYLRQGTGNNKLQIAPGTLFQKTGNTTGDSPTFLAYTFAGTEEVTIANGDVANPRVDLLQMKLEYEDNGSESRDFEDGTTHVITTTTPNKKHRVKCTLSVKTGTPAASPTYPDPDAGYVAVAGVVVGTNYVAAAGFTWGYDTAGAVAVVHDQRMPLRVKAWGTSAKLYYLATAWGFGAGYGTEVTSTNATNSLLIPCTNNSRCARIVGYVTRFANSTAITASFFSYPSGNAMNGMSFPSNGGSATGYTFPYYTFEASHTPVAGPTVQQSATNKIGAPVWTNGTRCAIPVFSVFTELNVWTGVRCQNMSNGAIVDGHALFYVAEGL